MFKGESYCGLLEKNNRTVHDGIIGLHESYDRLLFK
jgi:hypothetical protein